MFLPSCSKVIFLKNRVKVGLFWMLLALPLQATPIQTALDALLLPLQRDSLVAAYAVDVGTGQVLYGLQPERLMLPSSCEKVIAALAAFAVKGPESTLDTRLLLPQPLPKEGPYRGPMALRLGGDPTLKTAHLKQIFSALKGLESWEGPLYLEAPWNVAPVGPGWMSEDLLEKYAAPISPAILDGNCVGVRIDPSMIDQGCARASVAVAPAIFKAQSRIIVSPQAHGAIHSKWQGTTLVLSGSIRPGSGVQSFSLPIADPQVFIARSVRQVLQELGIVHKGPICWGRASGPSWLCVAAHSSPPLAKIAATALKKSDNLRAEALFFTAASTGSRSLDTWDAAGKNIQDIIKKHYQVDLSKAVISDGSGLSRFNLISPKNMVDLLISATKKPFFTVFKKSLAHNGEKGTLQYRLGEPQYLKRLYGKTGAMTGSCCLEGYLQRKDGRCIAFALFFSNYKNSATFYRKHQDAFCRELLTFQGGAGAPLTPH